MERNQIAVSGMEANEMSLPGAPSRTTAAARFLLTDIIDCAARWAQEYSETDPLPIEHLEFAEDAIIADKNSIPLDQDGRDRLFIQAGAPGAYLSKRGIHLQILALQEHLQQGDFGLAPSLVLRNGRFFTFRSTRLVGLTHFELLSAVAEALGTSGRGLTVSKIDQTDGHLELDLASVEKTREIRVGDVVTAGLHIEHSLYGNVATQIHAYIYRLVCKNGMTRRECSSVDGIVRTRKLPAGHPRAKELLLDQIGRLTVQTWDKLEQQLDELRSASERRADVPHLLRQWLQRARISTRVTGATPPRTVLDRLLTAWRAEGAEGTTYAAVNALTSVGSHDTELTSRQRRLLSFLGGLLAFSGLHICPRCFSVLSSPAEVREDHTAEAAITYSRNE